MTTFLKSLMFPAALTLAGCVSSSPEYQAAQADNFNATTDYVQQILASPVMACTSNITGAGFAAAALTADGFVKSKVGRGYKKQLSKGTISNPNGRSVTVGATRKGGCGMSLLSVGTFASARNGMIGALIKQGWTRDKTSRDLIYRRGSDALVLTGGAYQNIVSFNLERV